MNHYALCKLHSLVLKKRKRQTTDGGNSYVCQFMLTCAISMASSHSLGNLTRWVQIAGKGAGVKTAWEYHNQQSILPMVYRAGFTREDVFLETMLPCGGTYVYGIDTSITMTRPSL